MVLNPVVLKPNGHGLVPAHPGTHLSPPISGLIRVQMIPGHLFQTGLQSDLSVPQVRVPLAPLSGLADPGRDVVDPAGVLMLVPVLSPFTGAGEPFDSEIGIIPFLEQVITGLVWIEDRDGHRAGVDPTAFLRGGNPLDSVPACFVMKLIHSGTGHKDARLMLGRIQFLTLSAEPVGQPVICLSQIAHEKLAILTALGGADFDDSFHEIISFHLSGIYEPRV